MLRRSIIKIPIIVIISLIAIAGIFTIFSLIAIALWKQGVPEHIQEGITAAAHGGYMEGGYPRSRIHLGASSAYFMTDRQFEDRRHQYKCDAAYEAAVAEATYWYRNGDITIGEGQQAAIVALESLQCNYEKYLYPPQP